MNSYLGYAEILMEHHQYDRAVRMLKAGIELSYQQANAIYRSDLLKALSRCYEEDGMLVEALKYHKLYQLKQIAYIMRKRNVPWGDTCKIRYGTAGKRDKTKPSGIIGKGK